MEEIEKRNNFCCICGEPFKKIDGYVTKIPGETKGTYQCVECVNKQERKELLMNKGPAYISWVQNWDKLPKQLKIYIPDKQQYYIRPNKNYIVMIWED